jgi:hypothetical protein
MTEQTAAPQPTASKVAYYGLRDGLKCRECGILRADGDDCPSCGHDGSKRVELVFTSPTTILGERRDVMKQLTSVNPPSRVIVRSEPGQFDADTVWEDTDRFPRRICVYMGPRFRALDRPQPLAERKRLLARKKKQTGGK